MAFDFNFWDLALVIVVSLQVTAVAYIHAPRWKALILCMPFPFTIIFLGMGRPMDVTNVLGTVALLLYVHCIRWLHQRLRVPIVLSIALSLVVYCLFSWFIVGLVPATTETFWIGAAVVCLFAAVLHFGLHCRIEQAHRTPLPIWLKLPLIVVVVCLLLLLKESLQGFATTFPMVTVVGAYEARHSLWTLGRQIPIFIMTMIPMMVVVRLTQDHMGLEGAMALGWVAFLAVLLPMMRNHWASQPGD
jgi:hypothetical protein